MKHGRAVPFKIRKNGASSSYVGRCEHCGEEYAIGAPRWLPDDVVARKLMEAGMVGAGRMDKGVPRRLYCGSCANDTGDTMENILYDNLPAESEVRLKTVQPNTNYSFAMRIALPHQVGHIMREHNVQLVARFVRTGGGAVRMKIKPAAYGEGKRGGPRHKLEGDATRWYAVRAQMDRGGARNTRMHPTVNVSIPIMEQLVERPVRHLETNETVPIMSSLRRDKVRGQPVFSYDMPTLGDVVGVPSEDIHPDQAAADEAEQATRQEEDAVRQALSRQTEEAPEVPPAEPREFSVEGSLDELKRVLESANLHIMNLRDKGWTPEIMVGNDGHMRVKMTVRLS